MRRSRNSRNIRRLAAVLALFLMPVLTWGQGQEIHGENSVFAAHGVAIAWAVLKGATEEETQVILRIVPMEASFAAVRVEGVDPFTRNRQVIAEGPLRDRLDIRSPRTTFADFPRREIRLYRTDTEWQADAPFRTIFYLGVPDTTPEFTSEAALFTYLAEALAKVQGQTQGKKP